VTVVLDSGVNQGTVASLAEPSVNDFTSLEPGSEALGEGYPHPGNP